VRELAATAGGHLPHLVEGADRALLVACKPVGLGPRDGAQHDPLRLAEGDRRLRRLVEWLPPARQPSAGPRLA